MDDKDIELQLVDLNFRVKSMEHASVLFALLKKFRYEIGIVVLLVCNVGGLIHLDTLVREEIKSAVTRLKTHSTKASKINYNATIDKVKEIIDE